MWKVNEMNGNIWSAKLWTSYISVMPFWNKFWHFFQDKLLEFGFPMLAITGEIGRHLKIPKDLETLWAVQSCDNSQDCSANNDSRSFRGPTILENHWTILLIIASTTLLNIDMQNWNDWSLLWNGGKLHRQ